MRNSHEILHAKQSATHFILVDNDSIQIDDDLFAGSHWPTYIESCQLEDLEKQDDLISGSTSHQVLTPLVTILTLNRCWRAWKPACEKQKDRTSPMSGWLLVENRSGSRCSWTKDWYSTREASISLPFIHPRSKSPSNNRPSRCRGAWLSPPMIIAGQKQLSPHPTLERAATVDSTEVVNSSRNPRASRWNSFFKSELTILLRAANTRVPDKNSPSAIAGNLEWLANRYSSHCSTIGEELPCFFFCRRQ